MAEEEEGGGRATSATPASPRAAKTGAWTIIEHKDLLTFNLLLFQLIYPQ